MKFQSTRPIRGATSSFTYSHWLNPFQSTRPIRGATKTPGRRCISASIFQSTRPIRGATIVAKLCFPEARDFNPRAPYGARPEKHYLGTDHYIFQSTRPIRGATGHVYGGSTWELDNFNPRAPYGARRDCHLCPASRGPISIHAPHTGRDFQFRGWQDRIQISIHAPHTGRDTKPGNGYIVQVRFQSTRPIRGATEKIRPTNT